MNTSLETQIARMNAIMDKIDLGFVEAAHYERDRSFRIDAPAQVPMAKDNPEGKPSIEFYAPTQVSVLAYPVLYCLVCNAEHACAYTHKINADMGVCAANYGLVKPEQYQTSERVPTTADKSFTGRLTRS